MRRTRLVNSCVQPVALQRGGVPIAIEVRLDSGGNALAFASAACACPVGSGGAVARSRCSRCRPSTRGRFTPSRPVSMRISCICAAKARSEGIREATIQANVLTSASIAGSCELDQSQPGGPPNSSAISRRSRLISAHHVTPSLISRGQSRYSSNYGNLARIQARYGVDPGILMAIYGHETSYGAVTGGFDLLEALASLAYEGRRRALFESEFVAALRLIDLGVPRVAAEGQLGGRHRLSAVHALRLAAPRADGDGDGHADIWRSEPDALASIANYLRNAGWRPGLPWGVAVSVPPTLNRAADPVNTLDGAALPARLSRATAAG